MKSLSLKLGAICAILLFLAFIPRKDEPIDKLVALLQRWTDSIPQEKIYLHMDKPYYAIGDTIWFKGYVTIGSRHQLSALSGAVYVDLITEQDSVLKTLKLPITSGMVIGNFLLNEDLKAGSYRIRAYTQWMRNAGPEYFFDHTFTVGDIGGSNIVTKANYQYNNVNGEQVLTATLNYTDDQGRPLVGRDVRYNVMIGKKAIWSQNVKTDVQGNLPVKIINDKHVNQGGSYIHTSIQGADKYPVIRDFPIKASLVGTDVQYFPESGYLVNNISSRVAFKAVGIDGLGAAIKGTVVDEAGNAIVPFETLHAGMGTFLLKPTPGKSYTANIQFADGSTKSVALPKANDEGYVLSVYQPNKDSLLVRIHASAGLLPTTVNLIAHSSGEIIFASQIKLNSAVTSIWLDKASFPSGIAQFTLFSSNNEPLNERIVFIKSNDQLRLAIKTDKDAYESKEHIQLDLDAKDSKGKPTFGNFSVAVIDESKVPVDENVESTIFSNILLTADIKGYVEKPSYYFSKDDDEQVNKALDNLMLTQGYRRFNWKELNNTINTKPQFPAEGLHTVISGKVTTLTGKLLAGASVTLLSLRGGTTKSGFTDANGRFKLDGIFIVDSIKFAVQGRSIKNSDKVKIILDSIPKLRMNKNLNLADVSTNINETLKTYIAAGKKEDLVYEQTGQLDKVHRLREVRIRARKPEAPAYITQGAIRIPENIVDQTVVIKDPENCPDLAAYLAGVLNAITFRPYKPRADEPMIPLYPYLSSEPMRIIMNGRELGADEVGSVFDSRLDPASIVKIDVARTSKDVLRAIGIGPSLFIYTKKDFVRKYYDPSIVNITPKGFNKVREFYSPRYDRPGKAAALPDLRTIVYWNPYLKTNASGKTTFDFFNADGPGTYRVVVEGINEKGELGRIIFRYKI